MPKGVYIRTAKHKKALRGLFQKGNIPWNKGKKILQTKGERNGRWAGDKVGYQGVHSWLRREYGNASKCENCGTAESKRYEWANLSGGYKRDRRDWAELCVLCHRLIDNNYTWNKERNE